MKAALAESRRKRRQRRLEQLEIPEDQLTLTNELLGKGGFGAVYMADFNGRNAAVKVVEVEHDLGGPGGSLSRDGMSEGELGHRPSWSCYARGVGVIQEAA